MAEAGSESGDSQILYQTLPCRGIEAHRSRFRLHSGVGSGASMTQVDSLVDFISNQSKSRSDWLFGTQNRFVVIRILKTTKRLPKLSPPPSNAASYSTTHLHREQNNIAISSPPLLLFGLVPHGKSRRSPWGGHRYHRRMHSRSRARNV